MSGEGKLLSADGEPTLAGALERATPPEPLGLTFEQARIAGALFGQGAVPVTVGRFRVLDRLGAGGMGVVYSAYDPQLDRAVALKLVRAPDRNPETALSEAKALARLSHPNVVPVHDVGIAGAHVFMVMELVRGETLAGWVADRPLAEVVNVYRQAGEALAAAHAAGLVHRDFKPSNALVGTDGRVRVVDFGLACEAAGPADREGPGVAGTPRYMAPEQTAGAAITPAADQYSFCRSLQEALAATGPNRGQPPRWLQAIIERGTAARPDARFPTMRDLLRALSADPTRIRRRRTLVVAGVASLAAMALVVPQAQRLSRERACGDGDERLARAWSPADQTTALGRIAGLSAYGAKLAPLLARQLRGYAERWTTGYKDACLARFSGTLSEGLLDQRMACLERSRTVVASLPKLFDGTTASAVSGLALAVNALPSPETCSDLDALMSPVKPPPAHQRDRVGQLRSDLDRARVQVAAGKYPEASAVANGVASEARSLDYRPLIAEALLVEGHATMGMNRREAIAPLNEATTLALEVGANALAVEAWARRSWTEGTSGDVPGSLAGVELVEALAAGLPGPRFERSLLYNNIGCVEVAMQERGRAHRSFGRAFAEARDVTGPGAVELLIVQTNLAFTSDDPVRRDLLFTQGIERMTRLLGADHPQTLDAGLVWGRSEPRLARAREILQAACRGMEQHPSLSSLQATCWKELGIVRSELDDPVGASEAMAAGWRAASRQDKVGEGQYRGLEPDYLLRRGKFADAAQLFRTALAAVPQLPGEAWWRTVRRAEVELGLGRSLKALGDLRGAAAVLKAAVKRLVPLVDRQPRADFERRLGRARIELAHVLADQGKAHEALEFGTGGMEWLRRVGGSPLEIQKLTRLGVR